MRINLNDPEQFTIENIQKLVASGDDSTHSQVRVTNDGILFLSEIIGNQILDGIKFRLETFIANTDHIGLEASKDDSWINRIYNTLKENWPNPSSSYIDVF